MKTEIYQIETGADAGKWRWRTVDDAGQVVAISDQVFAHKEAAERGMQRRLAGRTGGASGFRPIGQ